MQSPTDKGTPELTLHERLAFVNADRAAMTVQ